MWLRGGGFQREGEMMMGKQLSAGQTVIPNGKKVAVSEGT